MNNNDNPIVVNPYPITANIEVSLDANQLLTQTQFPLTISTGLNDLLRLVFGKLHFFTEAKYARWEHDLRDYIGSLNKKLDAIPIDQRLEPKTSLIGPALDVSQYYIEEEELREMFAKLIASSMNIQTANVVHPSFTEIIKQLSVIDAQVLSSLNHIVSNFPVGKIQVSEKDKPNSFIHTGYNSLILSRLISPTNDTAQITRALNNFQRLGLIQIDFMNHFTNLTVYDPFMEQEVYKQAVNKFEKELGMTVTLGKGNVTFTQLGKDFINVCV